MLLQISHATTLTYSDLIAETIMELRVAPRQSDDQLRFAFTLGLGPAANATSYSDWLGNLVYVFSINPMHRNVQIVASSIVETHRKVPDLMALADTWPLPPLEYALYDYLQFSGPVEDSSELRSLVSLLGPSDGMSLGTLVMQILRLIHTQFTYEKGATGVSTPITEVLKHGRGVCQDFTHLMIGIARVLGIPARYVSGIIHSGNSSLRGAAQTHAWCELYFPSGGWVGLDPTNNALVDDRFVTVAVGRDYRDVPPNRGVYKGKAKETIAVEVTTTALTSLPHHLAGERIQPLGVPTYSEPPAPTALRLRQLEEQQQQQQQEREGRLHQQQQQQQ